MKESKSALLKNAGNSTSINETTTTNKEMELLKRELKKYKKQYNSEKKIRKNMADFNSGLIEDIHFLEQIKESQIAKIKSVEKSCKHWEESYEFTEESFSKTVSLLETAIKIYCNILLDSNNLSPVSNNDIEYHKAELNKMIAALSSLVKKNDLLGKHSITEFLNNQN